MGNGYFDRSPHYTAKKPNDTKINIKRTFAGFWIEYKKENVEFSFFLNDDEMEKLRTYITIELAKRSTEL